MDGRIFGLDIQLGFDVIMQGIAVFIMFALLSYILFEPVRKILEDRKNRIADEIDQAAADQAEAAKLKAEYDHKLKNVEKEADALMAQARKKALKREEEIVAGAKEEAARIIESANHEAELARIRCTGSDEAGDGQDGSLNGWQIHPEPDGREQTRMLLLIRPYRKWVIRHGFKSR